MLFPEASLFVALVYTQWDHSFHSGIQIPNSPKREIPFHIQSLCAFQSDLLVIILHDIHRYPIGFNTHLINRTSPIFPYTLSFISFGKEPYAHRPPVFHSLKDKI
nr:hypothetical protein Q903MT_gene4464 [Picea sitchensis]